MTKITNLNFSAAQLALIHNAVTTGAPVRKFTSESKAMQRTLYVLGENDLTLEEGARQAGLLPPAIPHDDPGSRQAGPAVEALAVEVPEAEKYDPASLHQAVNLLNGETVSVANLHQPVRKRTARDTSRRPSVKARKAALAAADALVGPDTAAAPKPVKPARKAPAAVVAPTKGGPARTNKTRPQILAALAVRGGATLAEVTTASGWAAPFELANLRILARKIEKTIAHDDGKGDARRYWLEG